jgi:hypothetical protein
MQSEDDHLSVDLPTYKDYLSEGFIPLLCKGYHPKYNPKRKYKTAKEPAFSGWNSPDYVPPTLAEIEAWEKEGGWAGWLIPKKIIVLDIEDPEDIARVRAICRARGIEPAIHQTNNGLHFFFLTDRELSALSEVFTKCGVKVTYRVGGKNYLILAPTNGRTWDLWKMPQELPTLPDEFLPYDRKSVNDVLSCLSRQVRTAYKEGHFSGYQELDAAFMALLISYKVEEEQVHQAFAIIFGPDYEEKRTHTMVERTRKRIEDGDPIIGAGTFMEKVKGQGLSKVERFARELQVVTGTGRATVREECSPPYFIDDNGYLCRWKEKNDTKISVRLANFNARIIEEVCEDNGLEQTHRFVLKGYTKGRALPRVNVTASQFPSMNWVFKEWGNQAILEAGQNTKDLVRHAMQVQSKDAEKKTVFTHTGWRKVGGIWVYLTASGAMGADDIFVKLPQTLDRYRLPLLPENEIEAIRTSLSFLDIGRHKVTFPLYGLLWLSPLTTLLNPTPNFSGYCSGDTGTFKTTVSILMLSHFGNFSQISDLSNFDDTANAIEKKAFCLKDTLLVLDDYHPSYRRQDAQQKEQLAQRLIREFSNRTGRDRLNPDTSDKGRYVPRGMLLITGEELVQLQSTLARIMVIEFLKEDINKGKLTELQSKADQLPHAMASYVLWVRENIEDIHKTFSARFKDLRDKASRHDTHRKLPEQVAFLQFGLESMLSWVVDKGALNESQGKELSQEGWKIFNTLSVKQSQRIEDDEPIKRFVDIIQALLKQKKVRLEQKDGEGVMGGDGNADLIGYYDDASQYFLPIPLWHAVKVYCAAEQTHFPLSKDTLYQRLANKGLIQTYNGRRTVPVRIKGEMMRVLKFLRRGISQNGVTEVTQEETLCTTTVYV